MAPVISGDVLIQVPHIQPILPMTKHVQSIPIPLMFVDPLNITNEDIYTLLLFTRPLPRDGGMTGDHGTPEAGQLARASSRGSRETESRQRASGAESVAGQCRMR